MVGNREFVGSKHGGAECRGKLQSHVGKFHGGDADPPSDKDGDYGRTDGSGAEYERTLGICDL